LGCIAYYVNSDLSRRWQSITAALSEADSNAVKVEDNKQASLTLNPASPQSMPKPSIRPQGFLSLPLTKGRQTSQHGSHVAHDQAKDNID